MSRVSSGHTMTTGGLADFVGSSITSDIASGNAQDLAPFRLLLRLHAGRATGVLGVQIESETVAVSFSGGKIVNTASDSQPNDVAVFEVISRDHALTVDRLEEAVDRTDRTGEDLGRSLYALGHMDARSLVKTLRAAHQDRLFRMLRASEGTWLFARADLLEGRIAPGPVALQTDRMLSEFLQLELRRFYHNDIEPLLAGATHLYLRTTAESRRRATALGFGERELHTMELLMDGNRRVNEVFQLSVMSRNATARLLLAAFVFGLIDPLVEPSGGLSVETLADELRAQLARMPVQDHFSRVGTHWANHPDEAAARRAELYKKFGPGGEVSRVGPVEAGLAAQLWALMEESYAVISDRVQRKSYRTSIIEAQQLDFSAELLHAHGKTAEFCHEFAAARRHYEAAIDLSSAEEYRKAIEKLDERKRTS